MKEVPMPKESDKSKKPASRKKLLETNGKKSQPLKRKGKINGHKPAKIKAEKEKSRPVFAVSEKIRAESDGNRAEVEKKRQYEIDFLRGILDKTPSIRYHLMKANHDSLLRKGERTMERAWEREVAAMAKVIGMAPAIHSLFGEARTGKPVIDSDADGLTDEEEAKWHTDPCLADTDGDGLNDFEEVFIYGSDPNDPDTNRNGVPDGEEVKRGMDPAGSGPLADFFIPTKNNNFHPHALSQRRLFFYGFSAVVMKLVLVFTILILPLEAFLAPGLNNKEIKKIISLTNNLRQTLQVKPLAESPVLELAAFEKAQDMLTRQYFAHLSPDKEGIAYWLKKDDYGFAVAGENLAMGYLDADSIVNAWIKSETHYQNLIDPDYTEIGVGSAIGLYENQETTFVAQFFGHPENDDLENSVPGRDAPRRVSTVANQEKVALPLAKAPDTAGTTALAIGAATADASGQTASLAALSTALASSTSTSADVIAVNPAGRDIFAKPDFSDTLSDASIASASRLALLPLPAPAILFPKDGAIDNKTDWILTISAPGAEKVFVYDNDVQAAILTPVGGSVQATLELAAGPHSLSVRSLRALETSQPSGISVTVDRTPPVLDSARSVLLASDNGANGQQIFLATAYLSPDTAEATVDFGSYRIPLKRDASEEGKWSGTLAVFKDPASSDFKTLIPATVKSWDSVGNTAVADLRFEGIKPAKLDRLSLYLFLKDNASHYLASMINISSWFYKFLLMISSITLLLSIFVQIRKQHPHIIIKTLGLILLLLALIVF